ncbi:MAG: hypothetical protein V1808_03660 [Candidatus Daviesbacteria bacterium]
MDPSDNNSSANNPPPDPNTVVPPPPADLGVAQPSDASQVPPLSVPPTSTFPPSGSVGPSPAPPVVEPIPPVAESVSAVDQSFAQVPPTPTSFGADQTNQTSVPEPPSVPDWSQTTASQSAPSVPEPVQPPVSEPFSTVAPALNPFAPEPTALPTSAPDVSAAAVPTWPPSPDTNLGGLTSPSLGGPPQFEEIPVSPAGNTDLGAGPLGSMEEPASQPAEPVPTFSPPVLPNAENPEESNSAPTWPTASPPLAGEASPFANTTVAPEPTADAEGSSSEYSPTDLSHLMDNSNPSVPGQTPPVPSNPQPETLVVPSQTGSDANQVVTAGGSNGLPKWVMIVGGLVVLLIVTAVSAYFILGIGRTGTSTTSVPAEQGPLTNPPKVIVPTAVPTTPMEATTSGGAGSFGNLGGGTSGVPSTPSAGTSAMDLIRSRISPTPTVAVAR